MLQQAERCRIGGLQHDVSFVGANVTAPAPAAGGVVLQVFVGGSVSYAYTTIPTYPSGQIGMMVCCKGQQLDVRTPRQPAPGSNSQLGIGPLRCAAGDLNR